MSKECFYLGKKASMGNRVQTRGKAKRLGGVGTKITGITRRKFKPNLHKVRAVVDGKVKRVWVSTQAIRMGLVQKPVVNKPFQLPQSDEKQ
ncbi:MAG: 50S ribosomal protein L28 [Mariniblastus sp.]|nr:50S ribosomal protein L28 [Mariniblastus sp.]